jgi:hypothetical protein
MAVEAKNKHINALVDNVREVERLQGIHSQITTKGPGRKHNVEVLHKSAIVLLVACWEAYVEDLIGAALNHMIVSCKDHKAFPKYVLERIASGHPGLKAWDLAGDGWKKTLRDNLTQVLVKTTGTLNTPKTAQVDELFQKTIGLPQISSSWHWKGRSVAQVTTALDDLVTLRGSIAHRVSAARNVQLKDVKEARSFVFRLAVRSHNHTCTFLKAQVGSAPWVGVKFGATV